MSCTLSSQALTNSLAQVFSPFWDWWPDLVVVAIECLVPPWLICFPSFIWCQSYCVWTIFVSYLDWYYNRLSSLLEQFPPRLLAIQLVGSPNVFIILGACIASRLIDTEDTVTSTTPYWPSVWLFSCFCNSLTFTCTLMQPC